MTFRLISKCNRISQPLDRCTIQGKSGQCVHKKCRLDFIRPKKTGSCDTDQNERTTIARRSTTSRFIFKEHCFFCGQPGKYEGRKRGYDVIPVRTKDFQDKIQEACRVRNDEWAETVRGRLEFAQDLHAADAVYHQACSVNFRRGKQFPKKHGNDTDSKHAKGRPVDTVKSKAFLKVTEFLVENDEGQLTIPDIVGKMQQYLEGTGELPYSAVYMKEKLKGLFGEKIVIITVNNRNVVTFHSTAASIISEFYKQPKVDDYEVEKSRIMKAAAKLITSDIKNLDASNTNYPCSREISSVDQALEFIPKLLQIFLKNIFVGKDISLKLASIGQAIIQRLWSISEL